MSPIREGSLVYVCRPLREHRLLVLSLWLGIFSVSISASDFLSFPKSIHSTCSYGDCNHATSDLLDLNGFYKFPLQKSVLKSLPQITQALVWLAFLIAGCAILLSFKIGSQAILIFFGVISTVLLLVKERIVVAHLLPG